jgi:hypothetical protein
MEALIGYYSQRRLDLGLTLSDPITAISDHTHRFSHPHGVSR